MSLLQTMGTGQGYLKAGFLGFQKSGKTYTAALLAIGTRKMFGLTGPIAMYDTEGGSEYIAPMVKREIGMDMVGLRSRSFDDLCNMAKECVEAGVSVLIVDSVTHVWRELCDAYMQQLNAQLAKKNRALRKRLEFQDWAHVKGAWGKWADFYINSPLHIVICGRAGYEYDFQEDSDGRKELVKTGIKMKTEGEFGFEPSLLVEMERDQEPDGNGGFRLRRRATVLGDRFGIIDGHTMMDPAFEFFRPHVEALTAGAHATVDTRIKSDLGVDEDGDGEWHRERKTRTILCEEIQGELVNAYPGQKAEDKKAKSDLIHSAFNTRSWTAVESMESSRLREGLRFIRESLHEATADEEMADAKSVFESQAKAVTDWIVKTKPEGGGCEQEFLDAAADWAAKAFEDNPVTRADCIEFVNKASEAQVRTLIEKCKIAAKAREEFMQPSIV